MELTFHGHACVSVVAGDGRRVVTDPYRSGALNGAIAHAPLKADADVVTVSHYHVDHGHVTADLGAPTVVDRAGAAGGFEFVVRPTYHDRVFGARMGMTSMIAFEVDGLRVAHLGDVGCELTREDVEALGRVDVLLWPTGGTYTLGPEDAPGVLAALRPRLAIPIHYENARCRLGMRPVDALAPFVPGLTRAVESTWSSADGLPSEPAVLVLPPQL